MALTLSSAFANDWLEHIFQNANIALIGDATGLRGSSTAGSLYLSMHTGDPGVGGDQTTNEATYGSYARVAVARSGSGWTVVANAVSNAAQVNFATATSGTETLTYVAVGTASSGTGYVLGSLPLNVPLDIVTGSKPAFAAGDLVFQTGGA